MSGRTLKNSQIQLCSRDGVNSRARRVIGSHLKTAVTALTPHPPNRTQQRSCQFVARDTPRRPGLGLSCSLRSLSLARPCSFCTSKDLIFWYFCRLQQVFFGLLTVEDLFFLIHSSCLPRRVGRGSWLLCGWCDQIEGGRFFRSWFDDFGFVIGVKCGGPDYYIAFMAICWSLEFDSLIYPALSLEECTILGQV